MKVITFLNEKGGVGKTTLATTLAAGLAIQGYSVLLLDTDAQATATEAFGLSKEPGFHDLLVRGQSWKQWLRLISPIRYTVPDESSDVTGRLMVLPGDAETRSVPNMVSNAGLLLKRLLELDGHVDYIILDTAPTPSLLHAMIYIATDMIIYPTLLETWSVRGLVEGLRHREEYSDFRRAKGMSEIIIGGIVPMMTNLNTNEHADNFRDLQANLGGAVWRPIPRRILWAEAAAASASIFAYMPDSPAAEDGKRLVQQFLAVMAHVE